MKQNTPSVIIGVDASQESEDAFNWYLDEGVQENHRLILAHCIISPNYAGVEHYIYNGLLDELKEKARQIKKKYAELLRLRGVNSTFITGIDRKAGSWLCKITRKEHSTLLVVGCRKHALISAIFRRTVLGSVSSYVLQNVLCDAAVCHGNQVTFQRAKVSQGHAKVNHGHAKVNRLNSTGSVRSDSSDLHNSAEFAPHQGVSMILPAELHQCQDIS